MAQTLNNVFFEVYSGSMKIEEYEGSEVSTCESFQDAILMNRQDSNSSDPWQEDADVIVHVSLTKEQILSIGAELLQGFGTPDFQMKLQDLLSSKSDAALVTGRMELALTVQSKVFPKYGLPGTFDGVAMLMEAMSPFMDDYMVQQMNWSVEDKLGMKAENSRPVIDGEMTKEQVLSMTKELLDGFSTADFQKELQALWELAKVSGSKKSATDVPLRMELALTVQSKVLPKYGFPGTSEGVVMMLDAIVPFMDDHTMQQLLWSIDEKLGMHA